MNIGENLKRIREAEKISQMELARKVGVSGPMICMIERGSKAMTMQLGVQLAAALDCDIREFVR